MSKAFERLKAEVRRRDGIVGPEDVPAEVAEAMLLELLDCPLCEELARRNEKSPPINVDH